jgi:hypothetical protein
VPGSFTSANAPSIPKLLLPKANTLFTGYSPMLDWSDSIPALGFSVSKYEVQLSSDPTFATVNITDKQAPSTDQPSLSPNIKYYWRVRAYGSNDDYSGWSSVSYFRSAMLAASLSAPINGVSVTTLPSFTWDAVDGASSYTIQVSTSSTFASTTLKKTVTGPTYTAVTALPAHTTLYWHVQAIGANGPSLWSDPGSFVTP